MLNINDTYARLYKIEDKGNYLTARLSTYRKDKKTNEYINSNWNCKIIGNKNLAGMPDKTKIKIVNGIVENKPYVDKEGNKKTWLEVVIFKLEIEAGQVSSKVDYDWGQDELPF